MPWRKYKSTEGKYGKIYKICKGVQVRYDARKKWTIFVTAKGQRSNTTVGEGRENFIKAIKAAEMVAEKLENLPHDFGHAKPEEETVSFQKYSEEWLENNRGQWDLLTHEKYEGNLRLHVWPFDEFCDPLAKISRRATKKRLRDLLKIRSSATVKSVYTVLSGIFSEAIDDKYIDFNPASGLLKKILPPVEKRNIKDADPFDIDDRDLFLETAKKTCLWRDVVILRVMAFTGMRLGETLAMQLQHFDFRKMNYYTSRSFRQHRFGTPKQGRKRFVDLPDFLVEDIKRYVTHLKKKSMSSGKGGEVDYLFLDPTDPPWPVSQRKIQGLMGRVCKEAELKVRHPHDLRHTYATILLMAHTSPAYIQRQLGHSKIQTTIDVYGHWIPGEGREGLEDALTGIDRKMHISAYKKEGST
jgi:integrase